MFNTILCLLLNTHYTHMYVYTNFLIVRPSPVPILINLGAKY